MDPVQAPDTQTSAPPDPATAPAQNTAPAAAAPAPAAAAPQMVPMIGPNGPVQVAADRADAAQAAGYKSAYKMTGPDGSPAYVAADRVDAARQANYAVAPDNPGVQKMVTPDGKITYAMPNEVSQFEASGHTKIAPDGRFEVKPLPGEYNTDTMRRAVNVGRALGPEQMQKSAQAEQNWWTSKEGLKDEAAGAVNLGLTGAETLATLAGGTGTAQAARAGLSALGETEAMQLLKSSPRLYAEYLLKNSVKPAAKAVVKEAYTHPIRTAGAVGGMGTAAHWLYKTVSGE